MKKNKKKIIFGITVLFVLIFSMSTFAYYTNIGKWLDQQTNPYVDGEGQIRLAEDFIEDGCGTDTILDTVTGLCWTKNLNVASGTRQWATDNSYPEPTWTGSGYSWPSGRVDTDYPAFNECNQLSTGGNSDWRMPTRAELLTLINEIGPSGTTCTTLDGFGFINCQNNWYWSSNQRGSSTSVALHVDLSTGLSSNGLKTSAGYVACVRRH